MSSAYQSYDASACVLCQVAPERLTDAVLVNITCLIWALPIPRFRFFRARVGPRGVGRHI